MKQSELNDILKKTAHEATMKERRASAVNLLTAAIKTVKASTDDKQYKTDDATKLTSDNDDQKTVEPVTGDDVREMADTNYRKGRSR
jgi:hypothetical protein